MALWAWLETSNDVPGCSTGTLASAPGLRSDDEHPHRLVGPVRAVPSKSSRAWTNPRPCSRGQSGSGWQPHEHRSMSYPAWLAYPLMGPTADVEDPVACLQDGASLHLGTVSGVDPDRKNGAPGGIRTPDQWLRKPLLYPAELRARCRTAAPPTSAGAGIAAP